MKKSDKLDDLRLKVGMVADRVNTQAEFFFGIINTMGKNLPPKFGVAIYSCRNGSFTKLISYGEVTEKKSVRFGEGMFSICSIRGKATILNDGQLTKVFAPFYDGHHLIGILFFEYCDTNYEITEEDYIFLKEITRFIELKRKRYKNASIDNFEI